MAQASNPLLTTGDVVREIIIYYLTRMGHSEQEIEQISTLKSNPCLHKATLNNLIKEVDQHFDREMDTEVQRLCEVHQDKRATSKFVYYMFNNLDLVYNSQPIGWKMHLRILKDAAELAAMIIHEFPYEVYNVYLFMTRKLNESALRNFRREHRRLCKDWITLTSKDVITEYLIRRLEESGYTKTYIYWKTGLVNREDLPHEFLDQIFHSTKNMQTSHLNSLVPLYNIGDDNKVYELLRELTNVYNGLPSSWKLHKMLLNDAGNFAVLMMTEDPLWVYEIVSWAVGMLDLPFNEDFRDIMGNGWEGFSIL